MQTGTNSEKLVLLSSTTNHQWPQSNIDEQGLMASTGRDMEKQSQQQNQQQLKCPRCDSSNTKFCYYNNYSLSQPRHFCKACKRYWTRGGTLRNVPVGGGCRKNKRVKRPSSSGNEGSLSSSSTGISSLSINPSLQPPHVDLSSASGPINPLFYGLPTNPFDLQRPQVNVLGLGFSSGLIMGNDNISNNNNPLLASYPVLGSSTSSTSTSSTLASLIASSLQQQKLFCSGLKDFQQGGGNFQGLFPFENGQMAGNDNIEGGAMVKEVKMEGGQNRLDWSVHNQNHQIQQINTSLSSDPSLWNTSGVGAWLDPSVPSLI